MSDSFVHDAPASRQGDDPHQWLEEWDSPAVSAWVRSENEGTLARLQGDPLYASFYEEAFSIASSKDRLAMPSKIFGRIYNFWRDAQNPQGVWRWATPESYDGGAPDWTVAIDLDALSLLEKRQWVLKSIVSCPSNERLCLIGLSDGGEDALVYREFDLVQQAFVQDGFVLPKSKQQAVWLDEGTLIISRDWGSGTMTASGYPFVVKVLDRGASLDEAREIFRGSHEDQLGTYAFVFRDSADHQLVIMVRWPTFFSTEKSVWSAETGITPLPVPPRAQPVGMIDGVLLFQTDEEWAEHPAGSLVSLELADIEAGTFNPQLAFAAGPRQALSGAAVTRDRAIVLYTDNVRGRIEVLSLLQDRRWSGRSLELGDNLAFSLAGTSRHDNHVYIVASGFLQPTTLTAIDVADDVSVRSIMALLDQFDPGNLVVEQREAVSSDGVRIPYFLVIRADAPRDGTTPTLLYAYGGFQVSMTPSYLGLVGKLWLERGGAYVVANIRGGSEFGPAWHDAGRKTKRQIVYDDFAAVAQDLFAQAITSPRRLGIFGGSNGGLLMGVQFTQHPEMWNAVTIQVPLLDMLRYQYIAAGSSWVDEYGSVENPEERAFLARISPYHNVVPGIAYPEPFIWTTSKDDRVGPQHARKFAARLAELNLPYLFYEEISGGHSGDANVEQSANIQSLQFVYFYRKLFSE